MPPVSMKIIGFATVGPSWKTRSAYGPQAFDGDPLKRYLSCRMHVGDVVSPATRVMHMLSVKNSAFEPAGRQRITPSAPGENEQSSLRWLSNQTSGCVIARPLS